MKKFNKRNEEWSYNPTLELNEMTILIYIEDDDSYQAIVGLDLRDYDDCQVLNFYHLHHLVKVFNIDTADAEYQKFKDYV